MTDKQSIVRTLLANKNTQPAMESATAFAPSNIALVKYWGKRNEGLHLPVTSSLSVSLGKRGATTRISLASGNCDEIIINDQVIASDTGLARRLCAYLDLFRGDKNVFFRVNSHSTVPIAAGLASSACGFAALVKALNQFFAWQLSDRALSILARLGSGSASRSFWHRFVLWQCGEREDGMDCYAQPVAPLWSDLCVGLLLFKTEPKKMSSGKAMRLTMASEFYQAWPARVDNDLKLTRQAIAARDFKLLGRTAERNALAMHACMLTAAPSIMYSCAETINAMKKIWQLRDQGLSLFFTQDAGPNLKLLFLEEDKHAVQTHFPNLEIVQPYREQLL
ncbi:MAG: diphosphomevalonate decarboxylase [Pseudomonadota bacterium]